MIDTHLSDICKINSKIGDVAEYHKATQRLCMARICERVKGAAQKENAAHIVTGAAVWMCSLSLLHFMSIGVIPFVVEIPAIGIFCGVFGLVRSMLKGAVVTG